MKLRLKPTKREIRGLKLTLAFGNFTYFRILAENQQVIV